MTIPRILPIFLLGLPALAQFDPKMPASVPEVNGAVVENFSMHYVDIAVGTGAPAAPGKEYTVHSPAGCAMELSSIPRWTARSRSNSCRASGW